MDNVDMVYMSLHVSLGAEAEDSLHATELDESVQGVVMLS